MSETKLLDRALFFGDPEISNAKLSPNGKWMSFMKPYKGIRNIWVKRTNAPFGDAIPVTSDSLRPIGSYFWSRNSSQLLYVQDQGGDENFQVYAVGPFHQAKEIIEVQARPLTHCKHARVYIYAVARLKRNVLYIGLNDRDPSWHDLYRLRTDTGELKLLRKNTDRITNWIFNRKDELRLAERTNDDGSTDLLRMDGKRSEVIYQCGPLESLHCIQFHDDGDRIYLNTNKGKEVDLSRLVLFNVHTLEEEHLESDPEGRVDLASVSFSDVDNRMIASYYEDDHLRIYWKDKSFETDYLFLKDQFGQKEISFNSGTKDERRWLIGVYSDTDPGSVYSFDRKTRRLKFQYRPRPLLKEEYLSPMEVIHYSSSDGLDIPAYLTLPKGLAAKNLPLVVNPHGGPWARDHWGYHPYAQFFANRGYAVLQMNFRGSTGFGKKFLDAGNRQWGDKMQDDITWGVKYLAGKGIIDSSRVAIFGGSYGGYATLAGVTFTPDVYACAISFVGPSSLLTLLASIPPYWEAGRTMFHLRMGDPRTAEGEAEMKRQSPLYSVEKIKTPLMIVQGANDPRVKKAESDQIVKALYYSGKEVRYLCAKDEGHGFSHPLNSMAFLAAAENFLSAHLGGRFQSDMPEDVAEKLKLMECSPELLDS